MTIRFACTSCGQKLSVPDDKAGVAARCPKCRQSLVVPASVPAPRTTPLRPPPPPASLPVGSVPRVASPPVVPSTGAKLEATRPSVARPDAAKPAAQSMAQTIAPPVSPPVALPPKPALAPSPPSPPAPLPTFPAIPTVHTEDASPSYDDETPPELAWMYEQADSPRPAARATAAPSGARVPVALVVVQGLLLIAMLAVGFGLGRVSQRERGAAPESLASRPAVLAGKVQYGTSGGTSFSDEGAVVLAFPAAQRPSSEDRLAYEGLRPIDPPLEANHASLEKLRLLGGGMARVDAQGQFRIALPKSGSYHVLVLSHHGARRANVAPNKADLAQIGRYVQMASELIGDRRYRWSTEEVVGQKQLLTSLPH